MATEAFFIVSGFMITGSFLRRQHLPSFLWARFLRIVPAYLCCLVFTSLVLGAALTTHPLSNYFSDSRVADYIIKNISFSTHMAWHLPGVFTENPKTQTINGSIWTLPAEVRMYLWVALLGFTGVLAKRWYATALIATLFIAGYASRYDLVMLPAIYAQMGAMFALGSLCYLHRSIIPSGWPCAAFLVIITFLSNKTAAYPYLFDLSLVQVCFCIAYFTPWYGFNRFGDYSYGVYIWGFPVQQTIAHFYPLLSPLDNAISALPITLALGAMSWYLVESPALKLKRIPSVFRKNVLKRQTHTE